jgi:hypothetical protein
VEALQQQRRLAIALGSTTFKIYNKFVTLLEVRHLDGGNIVNGGGRVNVSRREAAHENFAQKDTDNFLVIGMAHYP